MGTRAAFWIGDPRDYNNREWLGCKAWDGYPENEDFEDLLKAKTVEDFRKAVGVISSLSDDFANPDKGWPYPWDDNIFLTDYTYAFFNGQTQVTCFHRGFVPVKQLSEDGFEFPDEDNLPDNIQSEDKYDSSQPDSIMIMQIPKSNRNK